MGKQQLEEKIQEEIRKRVMEEEELKTQREQSMLERDGLDEVTKLDRAEIDQIAERVRAEVLQKEAARQKMQRMIAIAAVVLVLLTGMMSISQYNAMVKLDQQVKTQWSQLENVYQRRMDLLPNLIKTVEAYANQEQALAKMVTTARTTADAAAKTQGNIAQFQQMQNDLSGALQQMMVLMNNNPQTRTDDNFLSLQAQLEGSENRISVERKRFNEAVQAYNTYIKRFPQVFFAGLFGFKERTYQAEPGSANAPAVNFK